MRLTLGQIADAIAASCPESACDTDAPRVETDSRCLTPGAVFVALKSPSHDGHDYVDAAVRAGASAIVAERAMTLPVPVLVTEDTTRAYGQIGQLWRRQFAIPVIGITGSVGKTSTKEMIAATCSPLGPVVKTEKSQNTETGVPRTLLRLTEETRAAVVEMGMRGVGQIAELAAIACPTVGVITCIADNHIELLGSRAAIADAKSELLQGLSEDGIAILPADDPFLPQLRAAAPGRVITFGCSDGADIRGTDVEMTEAGWAFRVGSVKALVPSVSRHDVSNALAAWAAALAAGVPAEQIAAALRGYVAPPMRMEIVQTPSGATVINDAYNAAPASTDSALRTLHAAGGQRKIAFLGDMRELGDSAEAAHRAVGETIAALGSLDQLYTVGPLGALIPGAAARFADSAAAAAFAAHDLDVQAGDTILIKGSRAVGMEAIAAALAARQG